VLRRAHLLEPGLVFLNHGSFGATPRPVLAAAWRWQRAMERNPVAFLARRSGELLAQARQALAADLGAQADDLVFVPNATHGVHAVAQSLVDAGRLAPGDEVLATDHEYGACDAAWQRLCAAHGLRLRRVALPLPFAPGALVPRLLAALTPRTRLAFFSHITSPTALCLPAQPLCAALRTAGVLSLVDGAHAPGQLPLALDALGADFYVGNLHKWLGAPKGSAFLHARAEHHAVLRGPVTSWGDVDAVAALPQTWVYTGTGALQRRLQWQGTRDLSALLAVPEALAFRPPHGWPQQVARCAAMLDALQQRHAAARGPWAAPIATGPGRAPQMAALPVRLRGDDGPADPAAAEALRRHLLERHRIEVPVTLHGGRAYVRVSVQAYNDEADLAALERALGSAGV
jgi:isopenicillin-N epimerase